MNGSMHFCPRQIDLETVEIPAEGSHTFRWTGESFRLRAIDAPPRILASLVIESILIDDVEELTGAVPAEIFAPTPHVDGLARWGESYAIRVWNITAMPVRVRAKALGVERIAEVARVL